MNKILCIEDEDEIRDDISEELSDAGYDVAQASDGRTGLAAILETSPDLVLCDVNMPDMDGFGLLTALRNNHPEHDDVPFIFLSALADRTDVIAGKRLGADDYLTKPVDFEMLLVTVESRLRQVNRMNERKEQQLIRLYRALAPADDDAGSAQTETAPANAPAMTIVAVADYEFDLREIRTALESRGHRVIEMNSGKQFIDSQSSLAPDVLLVSFNTLDVQAPLLVRLLRDAPYPKVLMIPPSMHGMDRLDDMPGFDAAIRWPCGPEDIEARVTELGQRGQKAPSRGPRTEMPEAAIRAVTRAS
ncbi:MAG: response regulator [Alphaproteobacteria bacterium]|nr:response regulator [Alphaproteobacteria bacterium]